MRHSIPLLLLAAAASVAAMPASGAAASLAAAAATVALDGQAFRRPVHLEAMAGRTPEAVRAALTAALAAIHEAEAASDPGAGALGALNVGAGSGPQKVSAPMLDTLSRALNFCVWSEGIAGPLGGPLYELWGLRVPRTSLPAPDTLETAIAATTCDHLQVDVEHSLVSLAAGARLDLWGFATGAALDRAVEVLAARGVRDASLTLGSVQRAVGEGPGGNGWPLRAAVPAALTGFTSTVLLRGQSLAVASAADGALRAGGESWPPYLDMRAGKPGTGVLATVTITEMALDAQGLAATLFATGSRRGSLMLGQLQPSPVALWLLGDGIGEPLVSDYRWGTRQRRKDS